MSPPAPVLDGVFGPDRPALLRAFRDRHPALQTMIAESRERVRQRRALLPVITYPDELPVSQRAAEIKETIAESRVVVLCGETGSGKSTQLPKLCLELGRGVEGLIGHTQPRRLAARTVADRVASELGVKLGEQVGSKVRFSDETSERTLIKVMTDGIMLAESRSDPLLHQYDTIIVDEAHERSLNIDFLLGILSRILPRRPDLRLIITSATIDPDRFAAHFASVLGERVPILEISGRTYPVDIVHREPVDETGVRLETPEAIAAAAESLAIRDGGGPAGDVLVFLPGEREIRDAARELRRWSESGGVLRGIEIVPLYARLSIAEQQRVFRPAPRRRIVLATNVAETSITVPGIRYVIDTGLARISRYSPRKRVQSLQVEAISQSSARQRAGRCGRVAPGVCIRLYSEDDHARRDLFTPPEIQRTSLAGVILQMQSLGLGDPGRFPFIEPPEPRRIREGYETLYELGAVDERDAVTPLGVRMARLPLDPRIARILIAAEEEGSLGEALVVAASLETQDPRERPTEARDAADARHARFADRASDFVTLLNLWDHYHEQKERLSRSQLRRACQDQFISYIRMLEWTDVYRQLREVCTEMGLRVARRSRAEDPEHAGLHRAVLAGCLSTVGKLHEEGGYTSPGAGRFFIHPSSSVSAKGAEWLVAADLVRTTRLFARACAKVSAEWVEELAPHLIRREYSDAAYNPDQGRVEAVARVTLGDIEIARGRRVDYGSVDRADARRVFIDEALVQDGLRTKAPFERHNHALLEALRAQEAKLRRGLMPGDDAMRAFFDARVGPEISTATAFDRWRRSAEKSDPRLLFMTPESIGARPLGEADPRAAPDEIPVGTAGRATLIYRLEPGERSDGIEAGMTLADAARADPGRFDWLVPAWLEAKVEAVLRGLPRAVRRQTEIGPLSAEVARRLRFGEGDFYVAVASEAARISGLDITPTMCREVPIPDHLRMLLRVRAADDAEIAAGRDPVDIIAAARRAYVEQRRDPRLAPIQTAWPSELADAEHPVALVDAVTGVRLLEVPDTIARRQQHWLGCRRLVGFRLERETATLLRHTPGFERAAALYQTVDGASPLTAELAALVAEVDRPAHESPPETADALLRLADRCRSQLGDRVTRLVAIVEGTLTARHRALAAIDRASAPDQRPIARDAAFQAAQLMHAGTLRSLRWAQLTRLPAYFAGIEERLGRARGPGMQRDLQALTGVMVHWRRCIEAAAEDARIGRSTPAIEAYRWAIEEHRLTLFAPSLAVRGAGAVKQLEKLWAEAVSAGAVRTGTP
jgi:ATP-dependent helicase HrpA